MSEPERLITATERAVLQAAHALSCVYLQCQKSLPPAQYCERLQAMRAALNHLLDLVEQLNEEAWQEVMEETG